MTTPYTRRKARQSGQSLIVAIVVMFLMMFLATIFVTMLVRGVARTERTSDISAADQLAQAGVNYANEQLVNSPEGADWRPVPSYPDPATVPAEDPDAPWLKDGYTRIQQGERGRFLLKIGYDPRPDESKSKYIKIHSIGRIGQVDPKDPTTYGEAASKLRREKTAYKPLLLGDYIKFVTNKDRQTAVSDLGITTPVQPSQTDPQNDVAPPPLPNQFASIFIGPLRVNSNLSVFGWNHWLLDPSRGDRIEVAGDIRFGNRNLVFPGPPAQRDISSLPADLFEGARAELRTINPQGNVLAGPFVAQPSRPEDPAASFDTFGGLYNDEDRNTRYWEPPILEKADSVGGVTRYRMLTRNSGVWQQRQDGSWYNTGQYGWGTGVYIRNDEDVQDESDDYTLRADWMAAPQAGQSMRVGRTYWRGQFYVPPGVVIELRPNDMVLTYTDASRRGNVRHWMDENGSDTGQSSIIRPYPDPPAAGRPAELVIFAEGNIRIRGVLGTAEKPVSATIVSDRTIYIEGNLLAGEPNLNEKSSLALLARDYVAVNTSQFFGPVKGAEQAIPDTNGEPPYHYVVGPGREMIVHFSMGSDQNFNGQDVPPRLFVRQTADPGGGGITQFTLGVNMGNGPAAWNLFGFDGITLFDGSNRPGGVRPPTEYWLGPTAFALGAQVDSNAVDVGQYEQRAFELPMDNLFGGGIDNYLLFTTGSNGIGLSPGQAYWLGSYAIQPLEMKIQAMVYAQEGTFFVIPGMWLNPNPRDTREHYWQMAAQDPNYRRGLEFPYTWDIFPFYGDPLDVRLHFRGSITENRAATASEVTEWMRRWGWIPDQYGSSAGSPTAHNDAGAPVKGLSALNLQFNPGLTFEYDDRMAMAGLRQGNGLPTRLRVDRFGRTLPIVPRLPLSPVLIYQGEELRG
ncbi:MAG: hypothetical protein IT210_02540 [Armatimonadetes bacterium]|nr:hypothetical protein [Armatimonadota bacterium]